MNKQTGRRPEDYDKAYSNNRSPGIKRENDSLDRCRREENQITRN